MFVGGVKHSQILALAAQVRRIVHKHLQIRELPLAWGGGMVLTPREAQVLHAVGEHPGSRVTALAEILGVTKSAVSQMLKRLEEKGLIRKAPAWDNDRDVLVILSSRGEEAFGAHQDFHRKHMAALDHRLDRFSEEDLRVAEAVLEEVERTVDERLEELFP